jgi:hypothetical protein
MKYLHFDSVHPLALILAALRLAPTSFLFLAGQCVCFLLSQERGDIDASWN